MIIEDINDIKINDCGMDVIETNKFRINNKRLFLTYSGKHDKRALLEWFLVNVGEVKHYKIAHETYEEPDEFGNERFHTHFLLEFTNKPDIKNVARMDYLLTHPNIKRVSSTFHFANSIRYLDKEDEAPFTNMKINDFDENEALNELFNKIQSHNDWKNVINDQTIRKQVCNKLNWVKEVWNARPKTKMTSILKYQNLLPWQRELYNHLKEEPIQREIIWCWSDKPKQGKTVFKQYLQSKLNVLPIDFQSNKIGMNDIVHLYDNEDIIVFDLPFTKSKSLEKRLENAFNNDGDEFTSSTLIDTLENLSNKGQEFTSVKYMGRKIIINSHILVFSNCSPIYIKELLPDRLKIVDAKLEIQQ